MERIIKNINMLVNEVLESLLIQYNDELKLYKSFEYALKTTGKMKRAVFCSLCCNVVDENIPLNKVKMVLASIELMHLASLLHDDVLDKAEIRRDKLTINVVFGNDTAIITGDMLIFIAQKLILECELEDCRKIQILQILNTTYTQMCIGEGLEINYTEGLDTDLDIYYEIITKKTALFFQNICMVGGIIAGADKKQLKALSEFGLNYGLAYQIKDDLESALLLDTGEKSLICDLKNKIVTLPILITYKDCFEEEKSIMRDYYSNEENDDLMKIVDIIRGSATSETVSMIIERYKKKALDAIDIFENDYKFKISALIQN